MDTEKETDADVEESDEWFYNYFGRDNIAKVKEEAKEEVREEVKEGNANSSIIERIFNIELLLANVYYMEV